MLFFRRCIIARSPAPRRRLRLLFLRDMPKPSSALRIDFAAFLGPLFYSWLSQMLLPVIVSLLVHEKVRFKGEIGMDVRRE